MTTTALSQASSLPESIEQVILNPWQLAWRRFRRHRMAVIALIGLILIFAYIWLGGLLFSRGMCEPTGQYLTAEAYANWLAQRSGQRYRLPTSAEARALPATDGAKPVAQWLAECSDNCRKRVAHGASWRGQSGARPLDANRGYDDVGFRLVRDP